MRARRGFALLLVLAMVVILSMMLTGLFTAVGGPSLAGQKSDRQNALLYVSEAGLQEALVQLESQIDYVGTLSRTLPSGVGNYTVTFPATPSTGPFDCVNNLQGLAAADSHRGVGTVPPRTALIVVRAEAGSSTQTLEALVYQSAALPPDTALLGGGTIHISGNTTISGFQSLEQPDAVRVDVHSNGSSGANLVQWSGGLGESARIEGNVSSVGSGPGAINLASGATVTGNQNAGSSQRPLPSFDIPGTIASKTTAPAPTITPLGLTTLSTGEYYHSGDLTIDGDLDLQGAKLYVDGALTVNGSVRGEGAVYVNGDTALRGDSEIAANDSKGIALMSHGDVTLTGFDGNAYLGAVAAGDSSFATWLSSATDTIHDLQVDLAGGMSQISNWDHSAMTSYLFVLGPFATGTPTHDGYQANVIGQMSAKLSSLPADPDPSFESTRAFMVKRLDAIGHMFKGGGTHFGALGGDSYCVTHFLDTGDPGAIFDAVVDEQYQADPVRSSKAQQSWAAVKNLINTLDYDKLGRSYFQGLVYSDGNFTAVNDVTLVGAMAVKGNISLNSGVKVQYVKQMFQPGGAGSWAGSIRVACWLGK